jgi:hypothetical protein
LGTRPRSRNAPVAASGKDGSGTAEEEKGEGDPGSFNPFGFVTDNPSSRSAIQLPAVPAEDGNVGQMLYVMPQASPRLVSLSFDPSSCISMS